MTTMASLIEYSVTLGQDDLWTDINLDKVCRTCLAESNTMKSLFTSNDGIGSISIGSLLTLCTQLQVMEDDELPKVMCAECISCVTSTISFIRRAERADGRLREYIKRKRDTLSHKQEDGEEMDYDTCAVYQYDSEDDSPLSLLVSSSTNIRKAVESYQDSVSPERPRFPCPACPRTFTSTKYLSRHQEVAHAVLADSKEAASGYFKFSSSLFCCKFCTMSYSSEELVTGHVRLQHGGIQDVLDSIKVEEGEEELKAEGAPGRSADRFFCDICLKSFQSIEHYQKHTQNHFENRPTCRICDKSYSRIVSLRRHLKKHNSLDKLVCADFKNKFSLLADHEKVIHVRREDLTDEMLSDIIIEDIQEGRYWRYIVEPKSETEELELKKSEHLKGKHKIVLSESEEKLRRSRMKSRPVRLHRCSICNKEFTRTNHIIRHMMTHNYVFPHKCDKCSKVFANSKLLERHKRFRCKHLARPYECGECVLRFIDTKTLQRHISKVHVGEESIQVAPKVTKNCPQCGKGFKTQRYLDRHLITHMTDVLQCPVCQKVFKQKDNLRCHMRIHKPKREDSLNKFLCVYCGRSFACSSNYVIHIRRHTGEKPYKCDMCDKAFPRSCDLSCHKKMHTGEKPCVCTICGKAFSRSNKLVRHMRIHTGHRPYKCTYCDKSFTQTNDLTLHTRRHTGEKPYVCDVCGEAFIQGTALRVHRRKVGHPERTPPGLSSPAVPSHSVRNINRKTKQTPLYSEQ